MKKHFPKSFTQAYFNKSLSPSITVRFTLGKDKNEWRNGIIQNDPLFHLWHVWNVHEDGTLAEKLKMEMSVGGNIQIRPDWPKIGWRNKTSKPELILKHFDNYFKKMKGMISKYKDTYEFEPVSHKI
jgi:hypothetical protein